MRRGPLANSYPAAVALVVLALVPFLLLTAAVVPLADTISHSVGLSHRAFDLTVALSDAAYAFGTVLAVQFAVHRPARRMLLLYVSTFVAASAFATWAPDPRALQAAAGGWRPLFAGVAVLGLAAMAFSVLTFEDVPPADPNAPRDVAAIAAAGAGCAAAFFGAAQLQTNKTADLSAVAPLLVGSVLIVGMVAYEYHTREPLMPMRELASTVPLTGLLIVMFASSAAIGLTELILAALQRGHGPGQIAVLFLPEFGAAVVMAGIFGALLRTRFTPVFAMGGMATLATAAAVALRIPGGTSDGTIAVASALVGLGVGASVSPGLFIVGFSLRSVKIQRVFALVELLRGVTAFLVAPILLFLVAIVGANQVAGMRAAIWICFSLAVGGLVLAGGVFLAGRGRLQVPELQRWEEGHEPAWESPPLWDRIRGAEERERQPIG